MENYIIDFSKMTVEDVVNFIAAHWSNMTEEDKTSVSEGFVGKKSLAEFKATLDRYVN